MNNSDDMVSAGTKARRAGQTPEQRQEMLEFERENYESRRD